MVGVISYSARLCQHGARPRFRIEGERMTSATRPTLVTVARVAGVSVASASRTLNGRTVTPEVRRRVLAAAEQLGYVPDAAARSLRERRTRQLAFAVADIGNPFYVTMMGGIESLTRTEGYRLLVHSTGGDPADEVSLVESMSRRYVDGLIIDPIRVTDGLLRALARSASPIVVVSKLPEGSLVDTVYTDNASGVELAVKHLLACGRRRLAMVNGPPETMPGTVRGRAFQEALTAAGMAVDPASIEYAADFTHTAGRDAARRLLSRSQPDAVMCANDLIAVAVIRTLAEIGRRVPDDVAVAGIDDTELAELHLPSITSVSLESAALGKAAARMLLDRITDPDLPLRREVIAPRLVVRESTGPERSSTVPGHSPGPRVEVEGTGS
jgi:LacI family transcriptional regulator